MNVFAWKQYLDRGAEGQMTVLRHVLETTPLKPTLDFKCGGHQTYNLFKSGTRMFTMIT